MSLNDHRERLIRWLLKEQSGVCPLCRLPVFEDIEPDEFTLVGNPDWTFLVDLDRKPVYVNQFVAHPRCNITRSHSPDAIRTMKILKRERMDRWEVELTPAGTFKTASFQRTSAKKRKRR